MSIATLLGVARARGLFQRAILQSGAARNVHSPEAAARVAEVFCQEAGCPPDDLAARRALPLEAVLQAQLASTRRLARESGELPFQPALDGALLPRAPLTAVAEGEASHLPLLIGTNQDEWRYYGLGDPKAAGLDEAGLLRRLRRGLPGRDANGRELALRTLETYRAARREGTAVDAPALWFAIQTDRWFRHPAAQLAELQAAHQPDTRVYLFDWRSPAFGGALGACHALELPFVFGSLGHASLAPLVGEPAGARALAARIQDAWLGFAHGEEPAAAGLPAWPRYEVGRRATLRLAAEASVLEAPAELERSFWDEIAAGEAAGIIAS